MSWHRAKSGSSPRSPTARKRVTAQTKKCGPTIFGQSVASLLSRTARLEAARILTAADALPGTCPEVVAHRLGLRVVDERMPSSLNGYIRRGTLEIRIRRDLPPERRPHVVAHEIAELTLSERLPGELHERLCDEIAAAMLSA